MYRYSNFVILVYCEMCPSWEESVLQLPSQQIGSPTCYTTCAYVCVLGRVAIYVHACGSRDTGTVL